MPLTAGLDVFALLRSDSDGSISWILYFKTDISLIRS
jgi:hypothetical protein